MSNVTKICISCWLVFMPASTFADTPVHPFSYSVSSSNGKFIFVMVAPVSVEEDGSFMNDKDEVKAKTVRAKYTKSGLYLNDGSTAPLWTVDWYAPSTIIAADGVHLVRQGFPPAESLDAEAITFFANGKEIRTYNVGDFIDTTLLIPRSAAYIYWFESMNLDDESQTATLTTSSMGKFVFDYTSGKIVSSRRPIIAGVVIGGVVVILALVALIKRRSRVSKAAV
ncbi:MAG: hypothetical protein H0V27_02620 [Pyrinomonadaceae bacterium]|nr:hypothetical protein [Pyrinomonadaceae bacterium]